MKAALVGSAVLLTCGGALAQAENPKTVKGKWGLSTGVTLDRYKTDVTAFSWKRFGGILPMVTYTHGKNQFELGPQFLLGSPDLREIHRYFLGPPPQMDQQRNDQRVFGDILVHCFPAVDALGLEVFDHLRWRYHNAVDIA